MIKFWDITIPQLSGDMKRKAYVYVPDSFMEDTDQRYPVLYMFDGQNVFFDDHASYGKSWGMLEYLEKTDTQLIVAAVACDESPDNSRIIEYSPYNFYDPEFGKIRGRGRTTLEWYINEFKPFIDDNFPTRPEREYTLIGGSSMGGLMSLYAIVEYNDVFSGALCMSPSVQTAPNRIRSLIRKSRMDPRTDIYIDCGEHELNYFRDKINVQYDLIEQIQRKGICATGRIIPGGTHCEASWERQLPIAIPSLLYRINYCEE